MMSFYRHKMPDREIASQTISSDYWEGQASFWHEKYKDALDCKHELEVSASRYKEALKRLAEGKLTGERVRIVANNALKGE